jgi:hypothetical protein
LIKLTRTITVALTVLVLGACFASSQDLDGLRAPEQVRESKPLKLPYVFYNEGFGIAAGFVYGRTGFPQKQSAMLASIMVGATGSATGFFIGQDLRTPFSERLFLDPVASVGYFKDNQLYVDGNPAFPNEAAGSHVSDMDNYVEGDGWDNFFRLRFKYLLPIGHGRDTVVPDYQLERGQLVSGATGGESFNPFTSGRTYLEFRAFYRSQQAEGDHIDRDIKTNGLDYGLFWDNRDFASNPTRGFGLRAKGSQDFGWFDSSDSWTNLSLELDAYLPLGPAERSHQRVLAFDLWTSHSTSWDHAANGEIENRPPAYAGAQLGNLWRLRAYPPTRYSDKAAIVYATELRIMPRWNPFAGDSWLKKRLGVQWVQFVPFFELGRVAPTWDFGDLHSDMNWSAGLGMRLWTQGLVARLDFAVADESNRISMMVGQPFQF